MDENLSGGWTVVIAVISLVIMLACGFFLPFSPTGVNWIIVALTMLVFLTAIGIRINGHYAGILIDERNEMSLSRFQIVIWTVIILSGYLTIALSRIHAGVPDALGIGIDWQLWALLGISTTSLVGTPLILSQKKTIEPNKRYTNGIKEENYIGTVYVANKAQFKQIFTGDELVDKKFVNMAKVQMFFFTIIAALAYIVLLFNQISSTSPAEFTSFPVLPAGLIAILGISHAGYLTQKAVNSTPPEPP